MNLTERLGDLSDRASRTSVARDGFREVYITVQTIATRRRGPTPTGERDGSAAFVSLQTDRGQCLVSSTTRCVSDDEIVAVAEALVAEYEHPNFEVSL